VAEFVEDGAQLYSRARRLAGAVWVRVWQHYVCAYNEMADCAVNVTMDTQASARVAIPASGLTKLRLNRISTEILTSGARHL
jgi:hypothetical protein